MQKSNTMMALLIAGSLFVGAAHAAPPEGKGPNHKHSSEHSNKHSKDHSNKRKAAKKRDDQYDKQNLIGNLVYAGISAIQAREYARSAGFQGYSKLPPGIRKNLMRGKPLPPGIAKKVRSGAFFDALPQHPGYEWQTAGSELILVSIATGIIADILYDVFDN